MSKEKKLLNFLVVSTPLFILQLMIILYLILSVEAELKTLRDLGSDEAVELEEFIQKMKNR